MSTSLLRWSRLVAVLTAMMLVAVSLQPLSASAKSSPVTSGPGTSYSVKVQKSSYNGSLASLKNVSISKVQANLSKFYSKQIVKPDASKFRTQYDWNNPATRYMGLKTNLHLPKATIRVNKPGSGEEINPDEGQVHDPAMSGVYTFEGLNQGSNRTLFGFGWFPPDTVGDTSGNVDNNGFYVEVVNTSIAIWDYSKVNVFGGWPATVFGPAPTSILWSGTGTACEYTNDGDAIVLYDQQAKRWLVSQFALPEFDFYSYPWAAPFYECVAISKTSDPTGGWYTYAFPFYNMPDYPKLGIWPDGYYMTVNQFDPPSYDWGGAGIAVFDRKAMLAGHPANWFFWDTGYICSLTYQGSSDPWCGLGGMLPGDADTFPRLGTPNYVVQADDDAWNYPNVWEVPYDQLEMWSVVPDWAHHGATMSYAYQLQVDPFNTNLCDTNSAGCIPQPGTSQGLDALNDRLMHRLQYRDFGSYQAFVLNHTVSVDTDPTSTNTGAVAGIRWYELRNNNDNSGWGVYQQGTYEGVGSTNYDGLGDGNSRWMGSIAMDQIGNIALGYSVSNGTDMYPSIAYTGRSVGDPLGQMTATENFIANGGGSQTADQDGRGRWGDYTSMSVAPDGCSFVYANEYLRGTTPVEWYTRMGNFSFDDCVNTVSAQSQAAYDGYVTESSSGSGVGGARNAGSSIFMVGDDSANRQMKGILSFDTSGLPDTAVVTSVTIMVKRYGVIGTDPTTDHGAFLVDIVNPYFGASAGLESSDFQSSASASAIGTFGPLNGGWYTATLTSGVDNVNLTGTTQFRLYFDVYNNGDNGTDALKLFSGNAPAASRPVLVVHYYVP